MYTTNAIENLSTNTRGSLTIFQQLGLIPSSARPNPNLDDFFRRETPAMP